MSDEQNRPIPPEVRVELEERLRLKHGPTDVRCPKCGAPLKGWEVEAQKTLCEACERQQIAARLQALRARPSAERLADAGVPPRYRGCLKDTWEGGWPPGVMRWLNTDRETRGQQDPVLLIYGPPGTGKTHLATAIADICLAQMETVLWVSAQEMVEALRREVRSGSAGGGIMRRLVEAPVLVLDDLGAEQLSHEGSGWALERVRYLISRRYDQCRPTVVTTNLSPREYAALDPRLASRLVSGVVVKLAGRDRRLDARRAATGSKTTRGSQ